MDYYNIELDEGEVITSIQLNSGWMIDNFIFKTNKSRSFGPYGGDGGGSRYWNAPMEEAYVHSFTGLTGFTQGCMTIIQLACRWVQLK